MTKKEAENVKPGDQVVYIRQGKKRVSIVQEWDYPGYQHIVMVKHQKRGLLPVFPENILHHIPKGKTVDDTHWRHKVKKMIDQGKPKEEIAKALDLPESAIRELMVWYQKKS